MLGGVAGERGLQNLHHRFTAGWGSDSKAQPMVDLVDLEGEEGTALRLLDDECLDVLRGLGRNTSARVKPSRRSPRTCGKANPVG
jgi:hypothetical protein